MFRRVRMRAFCIYCVQGRRPGARFAPLAALPALIATFLLAAPAWSSPVTYILEGTLVCVPQTQNSTYCGPDIYQLNGATFQWRIPVDTDLVPASAFGPEPIYANYYSPDLSEISFFNRPGAADIVSAARSSGSVGTSISTTNFQDIPFGNLDTLAFPQTYIDVFPLSFMYADIKLRRTFFPDGAPGALPGAIAPLDVVAASAGFFFSTNYRFDVQNLQFSAIPIPPAVWLFGSALGVMGWMKRKSTA